MPPDLDRARMRSVDHLQRVYAFVVSLTFAESLRRTLLTANQTVDLRWSNKWIMSLSLVVTIIPFYHGANRYLDATYVTGERSYKYQYSLMIDFLFLFLQALLMFGLAVLITGETTQVSVNDRWFFGGLAVLLAIDVIWILITRFTTRDSRDEARKFRRWALVNIIAIAAISVLIYFARWEWLLVVSFVRFILDYVIAYDFYYPSPPPPRA